ncbi:Transposase for IS660 [Bacillus thuringiensis serovar andalousiensis BGSC 4AW1]|nr:Transposase for IS660 [Bacillus thuringiensis serovar andalousiensis BGSC 4AW1]
MRDGKPNGFHFLDHLMTDAKYNIITDTYVTARNMADFEPYLARLQAQIDKFGFKVEAVALDAGYFTGDICKKFLERNIFMAKGYILEYATTDREGYR